MISTLGEWDQHLPGFRYIARDDGDDHEITTTITKMMIMAMMIIKFKVGLQNIMHYEALSLRGVIFQAEVCVQSRFEVHLNIIGNQFI